MTCKDKPVIKYNRSNSKEDIKKQELSNRILATEIHCLKSQLEELDKDYEALVKMTPANDAATAAETFENSNVRAEALDNLKDDKDETSDVEADMEKEKAFNISDFVHTEKLDLEIEEQDPVQEMLDSVAALEQDILEAELVRDKVRGEADAAKQHADDLNAILLEALGPSDDREGDTSVPDFIKYLDLDRLLLENCKLQAEWGKHNSAQSDQTRSGLKGQTAFKSKVLRAAAVGGSKRSANVADQRQQVGFVTFAQVKKALTILNREPKLASKCQKYLLNTTQMLSESIADKDKEILIHQEVKETSLKKLEHLLKHQSSLPASSIQSAAVPLMDSSESTILEFVAKEEIEIDFQQPPKPAMITSLTNHNFSFDDYELLQHHDDSPSAELQTKKC